jgi:hypothetical protein
MSISDFDHSSVHFLGQFFVSNPSFEKFYASASPYERATLWTSYQQILSKPLLSSIQGIKEKLRDAGSESKLVSTLSELRIAAAFAELGFQVQLIPDQPKEWPKSPPDMALTDSSFKALIEVTRWAPDNTGELIYKLLAPIFEENDLILRFSLPAELSSLVVDGRQRCRREADVKNFAQAVINFVKSLDKTTLPLRETIHGVDLKIERAEPGWGRIGSWNTDWCFVPEDNYKDQLIERLAEKAAKPLRWPLAQQQHPYFIAFEIEQAVGQNDILPWILYGEKTYVEFMNPSERRAAATVYPSIVEDWLHTSWRDLLLMLGYDSTRRSYIDRNGFLLNDPNASRVCGVIILHSDSLAYYPNPFAKTTLLRSDYDQLLKVPIATVITTHDCRFE